MKKTIKCNKIEIKGYLSRHKIVKKVVDTFIKAGETNCTLICDALKHPCGEWYNATLIYDGTEMRHYVNGVKEPSSESFLHYSIYKEREDVKAIFHVHDDGVLKHAKEMNIPVTHEKKFYGTIELSSEAMKILKNYDYIALKGHGIVAMGKSIEETSRLVLKKFSEGKNN